MTEEIVREDHGNVLVARINRPDARNALNAAVMRGLANAVIDAEQNAEIRVLVITGTGDAAFCAGMDLREFAAGGESEVPPEFLRLVYGRVSVPVVAAVNGLAAGGGCELALASDLVVASAAATFALPEVKRGFFPASGVLHIAKRLPLAVAMEMALTGDQMDAARAYEFGFVNRVVPAEDVLAAALSLAHTIAANAPLGLAATKELVRLAAYGAPDLESRLAEWQQIVFTSVDAREGATAFVEKRAPRWQGR